jgi:hypothetical protein
MRYIRELSLAVAVSLLMTGCDKSAGPVGTQPTTTSATIKAAATATPATMAAKSPAVDSSKLDSQGYIRQWLILAPIGFGEKYNAEEIDKDQIPNEGNLMPKAGDKQRVASEEGDPGAYRTVQKDLTWKAVVTEDFFFDINEALGLDSSDAVGGYAVAYLEAPEEMKGITFSLCSNDNGKIFLNGKSIYTYVGGRSLSEDADTVENLTLNKGINVVIFKVWNDSNAWQGCLRLLTKDGKPVTNVKVRQSK